MSASEARSHRHPEVRRLRELLRDPAVRRTERAFVLEGPRLVADALDRGLRPETVYVATNGRTAFRVLVDRLDALSVPVRELKEGVLEKVGSTRTPQPVLGVMAMPPAPDLGAIRDGVVVVTAGVHDPGNLGTIVRSAEASGAVGVVAADGVDVWSPKVVRASAGSVLGIPVVTADDLARDLATLRAEGRRVVAADAAAPVDYCDADLRAPVAIVVGGEAHGIPDAIGGLVDVEVRIPMAGPTESLNVGVAASILLFEAARQSRT
ncbi:MAG: TrmH family RNA methyltransferase [Acidimicrobiia bacterium]